MRNVPDVRREHMETGFIRRRDDDEASVVAGVGGVASHVVDARSGARKLGASTQGRRRKGAHALRSPYTPPVPALALAPRL